MMSTLPNTLVEGPADLANMLFGLLLSFGANESGAGADSLNGSTGSSFFGAKVGCAFFCGGVETLSCFLSSV